jgi:hypothetical protein
VVATVIGRAIGHRQVHEVPLRSLELVGNSYAKADGFEDPMVDLLEYQPLD